MTENSYAQPRKIAEQALGKPLPPGAEVHHVDGDPANNARGNLVICESHLYHMLLHRRARAYRASGNPRWVKCVKCGVYDSPSRMYHYGRDGLRRKHAYCDPAPKKERSVGAFGTSIRTVRLQLGLTQSEFADLFNRTLPKSITTTRSDVSKYEAGHNTPPGDKLLKFLELGR